MPQEISKWAITQAIREVACDHCDARKNESCQLPSGRRYSGIHAERSKAYRELIGPTEFKVRHVIKSKTWKHLLIKLS